jgi:hypothetical protein
MDAIKGSTPEMAVVGIEFWGKFIMLDTIVFKEEFKLKLFEK